MDRLIRLLFFFAIALGMTNLYGCGGGGGGGVGVGTFTAQKAVIVFGTTLPSGSTERIGSIDLTIELPAGVTLPADSSGAIPNGPGGVLYLSGEALRFAAQPNAVTPFILGKFTPATATGKATVNLGILVTPNNGQGMNPGEFATLVCNLTPGVPIDQAAFKVTSAMIANTAAVKLYSTLDQITGPAALTYEITLQ